MLPLPLAASQAKSGIDPTLCLTAGEVFFSWNSLLFFSPDILLLLAAKKFYFHLIHSQNLFPKNIGLVSMSIFKLLILKFVIKMQEKVSSDDSFVKVIFVHCNVEWCTIYSMKSFWTCSCNAFRMISWSSRPQLDLHYPCYLLCLNTLQMEEKTTFAVLSCFVNIGYFKF